jgi:hypothetical protein
MKRPKAELLMEKIGARLDDELRVMLHAHLPDLETSERQDAPKVQLNN